MTLSASVVVDTMAVSALVNAGRDPDAAARYRSVIDGRSVVVSFVTVTEMRFGAIKAGWGEIRRRSLERGLARLVVVQPDDDLMRTCVELRAACLAAGHALGQKVHEADRWIAATAIALGVELISVDGLHREIGTPLLLGFPERCR
ncbi:MAG: PIN domain-containing protein [Actinomycetota bacterium]|nr:PIN domain-containing protein [Actinomycetota bacterium]